MIDLSKDILQDYDIEKLLYLISTFNHYDNSYIIINRYNILEKVKLKVKTYDNNRIIKLEVTDKYNTTIAHISLTKKIAELETLKCIKITQTIKKYIPSLTVIYDLMLIIDNQIKLNYKWER